MSKIIDEPVKAHEDKSSVLTAFIWRKRLYLVSEVVNCWREPGEWWKGNSMGLFIRVIARKSESGKGTYELYKLERQWFLFRVID